MGIQLRNLTVVDTEYEQKCDWPFSFVHQFVDEMRYNIEIDTLKASPVISNSE